MTRNLKLLWIYVLNGIRTGVYYLLPKYWVCRLCNNIALLPDVEKTEVNSDVAYNNIIKFIGSKLTCSNPSCYTHEYMVFRGIRVKKLFVGEWQGKIKKTWVGPFLR